MMGKAVVLDLTAKGIAHASISPDDLDEAERKLKQQGVEIHRKPLGRSHISNT